MGSNSGAGAAEAPKDSVAQCIQVIQKGSIDEKYKILPEISVLRSEEFMKPLLKTLKNGSRDDKEFAALALGALEQTESLDALFQALADRENHQGSGNQSLQTAIIVAMGEIGHDDAVPCLRRAMDLGFKGDIFFKKRQKLILSSAAYIAQQGGREAIEFLKEYLFCDDASLRAHAVTELSIAYWHRPDQIPEDLMESLLLLTRDKSSEVKTATVSSLANLADLGCKEAEIFFEGFAV